MSADSASTITFNSGIIIPLMKILHSATTAVTVIDSPPPYTDIIEELSDNLQTKQVEDSSALYEYFSKAFDNNDVDRAFREHMMKLAVTIGALEKDFCRVTDDIEEFDNKRYNDEGGQPFSSLKPDWTTLHERYNNVIRDSRRFASNIKARLSSFYKNILPMLQRSDASSIEKLEQLKQFLGVGGDEGSTETSEKLMKDETEAERITREFENLKRDIESFGIVLNQRLEDAKEGLRQEIKALGDKIDHLKSMLEEYERQRLWEAIKAGFNLAAYDRMMAELEHTIKITQDEQERASSRANEIPAVTASIVREVATSSKDIFTQLNNLISIYSYIRTDAQSAREHLESAINSDAPLVFRDGSIDLTIALYGKLEMVVTMYEHAFDG